MATIFSKIVAGEIPCYKVAEDERFFAFLDINPLAKGHTLVIPKQEVDYIFDLSDDDLAAMGVFAKPSLAARWAWLCWAWRCLMPTFTWCRCRLKKTCFSPIPS